jgi:tetratricopeptide (TPR) repeat protein
LNHVWIARSDSNKRTDTGVIVMGDSTLMNYSGAAIANSGATPPPIVPNIAAMFQQLSAELAIALNSPQQLSASLSVPGLPRQLGQDAQYQKALNRYIDRGFQPAILDQQNRLNFSKTLYRLMAELRSDNSPTPVDAVDRNQTSHRLLILVAPDHGDDRSDPPGPAPDAGVQAGSTEAIPNFLAQYYAPGVGGTLSRAAVTRPGGDSLSPIEYHANCFSDPIERHDISQIQRIFGSVPTMVLSSRGQSSPVSWQIDFWLGNDQRRATIVLPLEDQLECAPTENIQAENIQAENIQAVAKLAIAFVIDWYYLQLNLLYQPKLPQLSEAFSPEWLQAALPPIRSLHQRNQAIIFALQGKRSAELGLWENAIANYQIALELKPDFVDVLIAKGIARYRIGQYGRAIDLFNQVLSPQPESADALYYKGLALTKVGRAIEAVNCFVTLTRHHPTHVEAWSELGLLYQHQHRYIEAIQAFNHVIALRSDFPAALHHRDQSSSHYWMDWQMGHRYSETGPILALQLNARAPQLTIGQQNSQQLLKQITLPQGKLLHQIADHTAWVHAIAISPNHDWAAISSAEKQVELWPIGTQPALPQDAVKHLLGHRDWVNALAFSPDATILASGSSDKTIKLWSVATGQPLQTLSGHHDWVTALAFRPDGQYLASGSDDHTIKLWTDSSWQTLQRSMHLLPSWMGRGLQPTLEWMIQPDGIWQEACSLTGHSGKIHAIAFSPDGQYCASASEDGTVKIWQISSGEALRTLLGHAGAVHAVAFSPDGLFLASGGADGTIQIWSVATGKALRKFHGHFAAVDVLLFSADGTDLISGGHDRQVCLWVRQVGSSVLPVSDLNIADAHDSDATSSHYNLDKNNRRTAGAARSARLKPTAFSV